jgi:protein gp37
MGDTKIEWASSVGPDGATTKGKTWNPVVGCDKVSPGCKHCYAEVLAKRLRAMALADIADGKDPGRKRPYIDAVDANGRWTGKLITVPDALTIPLKKWRKPRMVFVNSMSDLFHESVPEYFIAAVFGVMAACPQHTFQVLTKRPDEAATWFEWAKRNDEIGGGVNCATTCLFGVPEANAWLTRNDPVEGDDPGEWEWDHLLEDPPEWPLPNVWIGTSAESQAEMDERWPALARCPAAVRFLSLEPLLGPIDIGFDVATCRCCKRSRWVKLNRPVMSDIGFIDVAPDWVIVGGESGPQAQVRLCDINWIRAIRDQCKAAGVPVFVKQLGARSVRLADRKGGDMAEWPDDLCVREFPEVSNA